MKVLNRQKSWQTNRRLSHPDAVRGTLNGTACKRMRALCGFTKGHVRVVNKAAGAKAFASRHFIRSALLPPLAALFGTGAGGRVKYTFENSTGRESQTKFAA